MKRGCFADQRNLTILVDNAQGHILRRVPDVGGVQRWSADPTSGDGLLLTYRGRQENHRKRQREAKGWISAYQLA